MEQVLFRLHVRTITNVSRILSPRLRAMTEKVILCLALLSLYMLYVLHQAYASASGPNCIVSEIGKIDHAPGIDILAVHISDGWASSVHGKRFATTQPFLGAAIDIKMLPIAGFNESFNYYGSFWSYFHSWTSVSTSFNVSNNAPKRTPCVVSPQEQSNDNACVKPEEIFSDRLYLFSLEKGYLLLGQDKLKKHNITRIDISVVDDHACFGPPLYSWLLHAFVGYDTVVKNWSVKYFGGEGFLLNVQSKVKP